MDLMLSLAAAIAVGVMAFIHFVFAFLEFFLPQKMIGWLKLPIREQPELGAACQIIKNAGIYNSFMAAGLLWSLYLWWIQKPVLAFYVAAFFLCCVMIAGLVGTLTLKSWVTLVAQTIFGAVALGLVWAAWSHDARGATHAAATQIDQSGQLVGEWSLVNVDGESPAALNVRSRVINVAADGRWTSAVQMQWKWEDMSLKGDGTWTSKGDEIAYTAGENSGSSTFRVEADRLTLDPGMTLKRDGTVDVVAEYRRMP